jgi:hypothetical protein
MTLAWTHQPRRSRRALSPLTRIAMPLRSVIG